MKEISRDIAIIFNPNAGTKDRLKEVDLASDKLQALGRRIEVFKTTGPGDATNLASNAVEKGFSIVVAAGGDGTLNETARGLIGKEAVLGQIPLGTANVWASETGISKKPTKALELIVNGKIHLIDTGNINGEMFLLMAGMGFDGELVGRVQAPGEGKRRKGVSQYLEHAVSVLSDFSGPSAEITMDGQVRKVAHMPQVWARNTRRIAYLGLGSKAYADDEALDVTIISAKKVHYLPATALALAGIDSPFMRSFRTAETVIFDLSKKVGMQVDGEPMRPGDHFEAKLKPASLKVLVPNREISIFSREPIYRQG